MLDALQALIKYRFCIPFSSTQHAYIVNLTNMNFDKIKQKCSCLLSTIAIAWKYICIWCVDSCFFSNSNRRKKTTENHFGMHKHAFMVNGWKLNFITADCMWFNFGKTCSSLNKVFPNNLRGILQFEQVMLRLLYNDIV